MLCQSALCFCKSDAQIFHIFCKSDAQVFHTFFERNASLFFSVILYLELVIVEFERIHRFFDPAIFCFKFKVSFSVSWLCQYFSRKKNYLTS